MADDDAVGFIGDAWDPREDITIAANYVAPGGCGYTAANFLADYPGLSSIPTAMLNNYLLMTNDAVTPGRWGAKWRIGIGLYTAHFVSLYLRTYNPSPAGVTPAVAAQTGEAQGLVASERIGDESVTYNIAALTKGIANAGSLLETTYGVQFATMMQQVGMGGAFII